MIGPLHELSVSEAGRALRRGQITAAALAAHALARIEEIDPQIHSFIHVTRRQALEEAERADRELQRGLDRGPLHGIPYALKDIYNTAGVATTCNSRLLLDHVPAEDAAVQFRLRAGGAVLLGKLNTHEFAFGGPSFDLPFPPVRNPWSLDHFTGGSSSGSGAAVAAGLVRVALGSDTGGSIRSPACLCGVVGLKPTYGLVSRRGVYPLSYSLDHCGPLAWTVEDAALTMEVIAGYDPLDPSSIDVPLPAFRSRIGQPLTGMRIGYARDFFAAAVSTSSEVLSSIDAAAEKLGSLGAIVDPAGMPFFDLFKACNRIIMTAEAFSIHEHGLRTRPLDYGRYTYQRIVPGAALSAADLTQAFRVRTELTRIINKEVLTNFDVLITATVLTPAPRLDEFLLDWPPPSSTMATHTAPFNVTGNPALTLPWGFSKSGLPLGVQIVGRPFEEPVVFQVAAALEAASGAPRRRPELPVRAGSASAERRA